MMAEIIMNHGVSGCFGTSLAPTDSALWFHSFMAEIPKITANRGIRKE